MIASPPRFVDLGPAERPVVGLPGDTESMVVPLDWLGAFRLPVACLSCARVYDRCGWRMQQWRKDHPEGRCR